MRGARRHAGWLSHIVDDLNDEDEGGLIIIEEGRVRLVMPVMVEADCDDDTVTRVVTLPEEIREGRDDRSPGEPAERAGGGGGTGSPAAPGSLSVRGSPYGHPAAQPSRPGR